MQRKALVFLGELVWIQQKRCLQLSAALWDKRRVVRHMLTAVTHTRSPLTYARLLLLPSAGPVSLATAMSCLGKPSETANARRTTRLGGCRDGAVIL